MGWWHLRAGEGGWAGVSLPWELGGTAGSQGDTVATDGDTISHLQ